MLNMTDTLVLDDPPQFHSGESTTHYSELSAHRDCPRKWAYKQVRGLEQDDDSPAPERDLGSWWHALRAVEGISQARQQETEALYLPDSIKTPAGTVEPPEATDDLLLQVDWWWRHRGDEFQDKWESSLTDSPRELLEGMNERWHRRWANQVANETVLAIEVPWERTVASVSGRSLTLVGTTDQVVYDRTRGAVILRDFKTSRHNAGDRRTQEVFFDSQTHLYAWGLAPWLAEHGYTVNFLGYDYIRTKPPKQPVLTKAGKLSKQVTDFDEITYQSFCEFHTEHEPEQATLDRLRSEPKEAVWAQRMFTPVSIATVKSHLQAAADTAEAMDQTRQREEMTHDSPRNPGYLCGWCPFLELCTQEVKHGPLTNLDDDQLAQMGLRST